MVGLSGLDGVVDRRLQPLTIGGLEKLQGLLLRQRFSHRQVVEAVQLIGPGDFSGAQVIFPTADPGHSTGFAQQLLALSQFL